MEIDGACGSSFRSDSDRNPLEGDAHQSSQISGSGYLSGSTVDVWLLSEPHYLGSWTPGADRRFIGSVSVGEAFIGSHTLQINGTSPDVRVLSVNVGVGVLPARIPGVGILLSAGATHETVILVAGAMLAIGLFVRRSLRGRAV